MTRPPVRIPLYQIDAFTDSVFHGNPAAVCPLEQWLPDETLLAIAAENNLSETAFLVPKERGFHIRWFTPVREVDLCGHATLASAHLLYNVLGFAGDRIALDSRSGPLAVTHRDGLIELDFPASPPQPCETPPIVSRAFGLVPVETHKSGDYLVLFDREEDVRALRPDFSVLMSTGARGVIATAPGSGVDFVSRFFAPAYGIDEDPVTGSAHCTLVPFWAEKLGRTRLRARQISPRGGELWCELRGDRVLIAGRAVLYSEGAILL